MERVLDQQGRWRNKVVAFRMSPEEDEVLEAKVKLSGLTKQEYIIRRLTDRGNHRSRQPKGLQSPARPDGADLSGIATAGRG